MKRTFAPSCPPTDQEEERARQGGTTNTTALQGLALLLIACLLGAGPAAAATVQLTASEPAAVGIRLAVTVEASAATDLYGMAVDVVYDPAYLAVEDADPLTPGVQPMITEGTALNENAATPTILRAALEDDKQGRLVVGLTRRAPTASGVDLTSLTGLFTVTFKPLKAGSTAIAFARPTLFDSQQNPITADSWTAADLAIVGTLTIGVTSSEHGRVEPEGEVAVLTGTDMTFAMIPDTGFVVATVYIDGRKIGPHNTYTFTNVTVDHTLRAIFRRLPGDLDGDGAVSLGDAILAASVLARLPVSLAIHLDADVNADNRIGNEELVYILHQLAQ